MKIRAAKTISSPPISVSTKTGDKGQASLANGQRVTKSHLVFTAIGSIDELNSWLGLVVAKMRSSYSTSKSSKSKHSAQHLSNKQFLKCQKQLLTIQNTLFYIGAELACSPKTKLKTQALTQIEKASIKLQNSMADDWHTKFILPGGTELGAELDIARAVCRRAERAVVLYDQSLKKDAKYNYGLKNSGHKTLNDCLVRPLVIKYLNRLSDYLYILRCFVNHLADFDEKEFDSRD